VFDIKRNRGHFVFLIHHFSSFTAALWGWLGRPEGVMTVSFYHLMITLSALKQRFSRHGYLIQDNPRATPLEKPSNVTKRHSRRQPDGQFQRARMHDIPFLFFLQ